jgi:hypothetical protein
MTQLWKSKSSFTGLCMALSEILCVAAKCSMLQRRFLMTIIMT